jgi:hypothetical protein
MSTMAANATYEIAFVAAAHLLIYSTSKRGKLQAGMGLLDISACLIANTGIADGNRLTSKEYQRTAAPGGDHLLSTSNSVHPGVKPECYLTQGCCKVVITKERSD